MTDLERYIAINNCETKEELKEAIMAIADENGMIQNRTKKRPAINTVNAVDEVFKGYPARLLTRAYGIRQQALYIMHYENL